MDIGDVMNPKFANKSQYTEQQQAFCGASLEDSPQQKLFRSQLIDFEELVKHASTVNAGCTFTGLLGALMTKSGKLIEATVISVVLNAVWVAGYMIVRRMIKDIEHVQFRNLSGHTSFEMLIVFCQTCIVISVAVFCYALPIANGITEEIFELSVLNHTPDKWEEEYQH